MNHNYILKLGWIILFLSCQNKLDGKVQNIRCRYVAWACDCANWATLEDMKKYGNAGGNTLADHCIFMEPADTSLILPESLSSMAIVEFTGQFYKYKGFPKGYKSIEMPDKARIFRYTRYRVIQRNAP